MDARAGDEGRLFIESGGGAFGVRALDAQEVGEIRRNRPLLTGRRMPELLLREATDMFERARAALGTL